MGKKPKQESKLVCRRAKNFNGKVNQRINGQKIQTGK